MGERRQGRPVRLRLISSRDSSGVRLFRLVDGYHGGMLERPESPVVGAPRRDGSRDRSDIVAMIDVGQPAPCGSESPVHGREDQMSAEQIDLAMRYSAAWAGHDPD